MPAEDAYLVRPAPGVYAYVQPDGGWTLLVDTAATERRALALRAAVLAAGVPLPRTLVNTHHHGDHTYGNGVFLPEAVVIGHDSCRSEQLAAGHQLHLMWPDTDFGDISIFAPTMTYNDRLTVHVGDIEVRLIHPGAV